MARITKVVPTPAKNMRALDAMAVTPDMATNARLSLAFLDPETKQWKPAGFFEGLTNAARDRRSLAGA